MLAQPALHHAATDTTMLPLFRNHPGIGLIEPCRKLLPLAGFGGGPWAWWPAKARVAGPRFTLARRR